MPTYTLTLLDTTGIQNYIFGSNVLRENIGGSHLVWQATRLWPFEVVRRIGKSNVTAEDLTGTLDDLDDTRQIEAGQGVEAEVIYAGGGQCAILFVSRELARKFAIELSRWAIAEAPELDLIITHTEVIWPDRESGEQGDALAQKEQEAAANLRVKKQSRPLSKPLLGLGTSVACQSTGLSATGTDIQNKPDNAAARPLSASILAKLDVVPAANDRLEEYLPAFEKVETGDRLEIPRELDKFGRQAGDISYIAVVHADGNNLGERIRKIQSCFITAKQNRAYITVRREFSRAIEKGAQETLAKVSKLLLKHWHPNERVIKGQAVDETKRQTELGEIELATQKDKTYIPFRPLVFGGDDLTFITDGRLGLSLTTAYLAAFKETMQTYLDRFTTKIAQTIEPETLNEINEQEIGHLEACAGIAIVKTHYPFARAYQLADDLCHNAKLKWDRKYPAIDWHIAPTGIFGNVDTLREEQYQVRFRERQANQEVGYLEMRPLIITGQNDGWRSWVKFGQVLKTFALDEMHWAGKHNKIIALRLALRQGPEAVKQFRSAYKLDRLPLLDESTDALQTTGWYSVGEWRCGYFDAIEALDFFVPLEG